MQLKAKQVPRFNTLFYKSKYNNHLHIGLLSRNKLRNFTHYEQH
ncbi:hypothetical protein SPWS13_1258 [Shewanella putrefaciens]|nr:hypothetical protein SPWS13_1258 [Shewanella putrefaciens]